MKVRILWLGLWLVFAAALLGFPSEALAGGRTVEPAHPLAHAFCFLSWFKDNLVHLAVANTSSSTQTLKVAIGWGAVGPQPFLSQTFSAPSNTVHLLTFPLELRLQQGRMKSLDYAFLFVRTENRWEQIFYHPIQNIGDPAPEARMDEYLVAAGTAGLFRFVPKQVNNPRVIFVGKAIKVDGHTSLPGQPMKPEPKPAQREDLRKIDPGEPSLSLMVKELADNFAFILQPFDRQEIVIGYQANVTAKCVIVNVPLARRAIQPPWEVGSGSGPFFMIYNPASMTVQKPADLQIVDESRGTPPGPPQK